MYAFTPFTGQKYSGLQNSKQFTRETYEVMTVTAKVTCIYLYINAVDEAPGRRYVRMNL